MYTRALMVVLVALVTSACVGSPVPPQIAAPVLAPVVPPVVLPRAPSETLVHAASLFGEQPGYNFSTELTLSGIPETGGAPLSITASGSTDVARNRTAVSLDLGGLVAAARFAGESGAEFEAMLGDGRIDVIQDGSTIYLRMPFLAREAGVTTPWLSLTMSDVPATAEGRLPGLFGQLAGAGSPAAYFMQLRAMDGTVVENGTGDVRGVATTRYRGTLDLAKLLGHSLPATDASRDVMMPFFEALKLPYEVWVDAEGLPRRLTATLDFRSFAPAGAVAAEPAPALTFTYDLFDFGAPTAIALPVDSAVTALDPAILSTLREGATGERSPQSLR